jgi:uncharacterized protein DUF5317
VALALPLLAGLAISPLFGGRWRKLAELRLHAIWLFFVAFALQLVAYPVKALPWRTPDSLAVALWLCSYGLFLLAVGFNVRIPGVPAVAVGMLANLTAIVANGGHMPALPTALRAAGLHFVRSRNSTASASPHVAWLVDRWAAPPWVPFANVFSIGDVAIAIGGVIFALAATGAFQRRVPPTPNRGRSAVLRRVSGRSV